MAPLIFMSWGGVTDLPKKAPPGEKPTERINLTATPSSLPGNKTQETLGGEKMGSKLGKTTTLSITSCNEGKFLKPLGRK